MGKVEYIGGVSKYAKNISKVLKKGELEIRKYEIILSI